MPPEGHAACLDSWRHYFLGGIRRGLGGRSLVVLCMVTWCKPPDANHTSAPQQHSLWLWLRHYISQYPEINSPMDPITGIGLAASVIQLLSFSIDAVKTCQEVYQKGSISDYSNLDYTTGHLADLTISLQQSLQSSGARSRVSTGEEQDLVELARNCEECAKKLQKELDKLQTQSGASTLKAVRLTARAIWKKSSIDRINQQLQAYQSTLETSLLARLR